MQPWWAEETYFKTSYWPQSDWITKHLYSPVFSVVYLRLDVKSRPECVRRAREDTNKISQISCSGGFMHLRNHRFQTAASSARTHKHLDTPQMKIRWQSIWTYRYAQGGEQMSTGTIKCNIFHGFVWPDFFSSSSVLFLAVLHLPRANLPHQVKETCNQDSTASWRTDHFHSILNRFWS